MNEATWQFVRRHGNDDVRQLALKGCRHPEVDLPMALQQIQGRQAALQKIPTWAATDGILFPPHLSMEQCSSESTARYKARIVSNWLHAVTADSSLFVDLTGGFGVDFAFLAPLFQKAVYVERQEQLCAIARQNFGLLPGLGSKVAVEQADATDYLNSMDGHASLVFLDPARRDAHGDRTFGMAECTPNVLAMLDTLLAKADGVLLKLSPMLDWRKAVADVGNGRVEQVHIMAIGGECKELLLLLSAKAGNRPLLVCASDDSSEVFPLIGEPSSFAGTPFGEPQAGSFLYEPNAALMKAGRYDELARRYDVLPLAANSHLFVSVEEVAFPGRHFEICDVSSMNKHELKEKILPLRQANIAVRNFPLSVADLRRRLKLGEGGGNYLFATTLADGRHILVVARKTAYFTSS